MIPFIDISDINCWIVYLMPFNLSERTDYNTVLDLQKECITRKFFGMGWDIPCFEQGTEMTDENAHIYSQKYRKCYESEGWTVSDAAIEGYKSVKKGDYVITRLKNGHYYVGRVSNDKSEYIYKENDPIYGLFSWGGKVENWVEYENDQEVPSEIVGRFSQRLHSTIQRIAPYRQRMLVISMYEKKTDSPRPSFEDIPKLRIGKNNFVRSLNYMELEDLVAMYIADKHEKEGYRLIPSSCKISQQNYEFTFVSKGKKPITCQVKNQQDITIENYLGETSYEKIYIFSGLWDAETIEAKNNFCIENNCKNIYVISPSDLYPILKKEQFISNDFYDFKNEPKYPSEIRLKLEGYEERKKPKGEKTYSIDDEFICFVNSDGLFYSSEFEALIFNRNIFDNTSYTRNCIEDIKKAINREL